VNEASAVASKVCPVCGARYPGDALFCPNDGMPLVSAAAAGREAEDDPYLGQEISGHIEIRQLVGIGAMGRVYRAFQRGIDRDVAVKILHRELSANSQLVSRFTREAKVASRLQHPNVVQVLLAGQLPDRALYMVMEYLDGLSLQSALAAAGGALPLPRALHVCMQLCEATGEAHAQGIVHRDLKPENVMLVRRGADPDFVKVLDFGIARINWGEQSIATAAGLIFGTARYISPEGAQGNAVGPASDVYSIATLLYQMLAGRTPFEGDQAVGLLVQQIHDPPPHLKSIPRGEYVPAQIADVIMANLVKDPKRREQDARSFGHAIVDAAKAAGLSPEDISRPMLRRQPSAMQLPPTERTKQLDLTPDVSRRMGPPSSDPGAGTNGASSHPNGRPMTAATAKWEPSPEFQARLAEAIPSHDREHDRSSGIVPAPPSSRALHTGPPTAPPVAQARSRVNAVDETLDDASAEPPVALPRGATSPPTFPPVRDVHSVPRTMPGDADGPHTQYTPPVPGATTAPPPVAHESQPSMPVRDPAREARHARTQPPTSHGAHASHGEPGRSSRGIVFVLLCFVLGAALAAGWAWNTGKLGSYGDDERFVTRATDAMYKNHFVDPPGDNVRDITDEGLKRWPNNHRLLDVRQRAANELTQQAMTQRSAGDVAEALRLARAARELDPNDASAKRLVDQYEAELASFATPTAPPLTKPPPVPQGPPPKPQGAPPPASAQPPLPGPGASAYKALLEANADKPRLGQTVEFVARIAPAKGDFDQPTFTITGPGLSGARMPAQSAAPGVFRASYAFLEPGRFEIAFTTQVDGKAIKATKVVAAGDAGAPPKPEPLPSTPTAPTATASVKWM